MTPLRQRMIDDMRLAGFAERTREVYIQAVRRIAAHYMRSPDVLSEEEVRAYLLHLRDERGVARGTFKTNHGGIRFLYSRTLDFDWALFSQKNAFARRGSSGCRSCSLMPRSAPSCLGILSLVKSYGPERIEAAARRGNDIRATTYGSIKSILQNGLDRAFAKPNMPDTSPIRHANIRGRGYYH